MMTQISGITHEVGAQVRKKFNLVLCDIHNVRIHGFDGESDPTVQGHYLVNGRYHYDSHYAKRKQLRSEQENLESDTETDTEYDSEYDSENELDDDETPGIYKSLSEFRYIYKRNILTNRHYHIHPFIRNYKHIIQRPTYIQPEIAQCIYLSGDECVAILKTFWIRIIQRTWKRVFQTRREILRKRMLPQNLRERETHGKWPMTCRYYPGIRGMLA
jgi:hypothetical protein